MAYSNSLADRVRALLGRERGIADKKMFGGVGFLLHGNMCVGIWQDSLIVRVGPEEHAAALARPFARPFDITGRPMTGWVMVEPDGLDAERDLCRWVELGLRFVQTLPAKPAAKSSALGQAGTKKAARARNTPAQKKPRGNAPKR